MPPDSTMTKKRILDAARLEFARLGLAGARVDRIAETALANKRSIYVHFGNKEQLFEIVIADALREMSESVPFEAGDLPGYAGRLFDYLLADPDTVRLTAWARLERPQASAGESAAYQPKIEALEQYFPGRAVHVLVLVLGLVTAWSAASPALLALDGGRTWTPQRLDRFRAEMVECVASIGEPVRT